MGRAHFWGSLGVRRLVKGGCDGASGCAGFVVQGAHGNACPATAHHDGSRPARTQPSDQQSPQPSPPRNAAPLPTCPRRSKLHLSDEVSTKCNSVRTSESGDGGPADDPTLSPLLPQILAVSAPAAVPDDRLPACGQAACRSGDAGLWESGGGGQGLGVPEPKWEKRPPPAWPVDPPLGTHRACMALACACTPPTGRRDQEPGAVHGAQVRGPGAPGCARGGAPQVVGGAGFPHASCMCGR